MSHWYQPYLAEFGKPIRQVPAEILKTVQQKLQNKRNEQPLVSVILIAHNEGSHLLSCLWSLVDNQCTLPMEIMVVNNNSTDNTENVLKELGVTYFNETKKGPGHARQCGLDHAKGKYHLCIDADTMYPPHYITTHVKKLMKPGVACTYSLWSFIPDDKRSGISLWCYESLRDIYLKMQSIKRPELCVRGMTFGFNTELGRKFGFRTDIIRGEDGSLALAMKKHGKLVFITSRKARVLTSNGTLNAEGGMTTNLRVRMVKALKEFTGLFTKKESYKDEDKNLLSKKN